MTTQQKAANTLSDINVLLYRVRDSLWTDSARDKGCARKVLSELTLISRRLDRLHFALLYPIQAVENGTLEPPLQEGK